MGSNEFPPPPPPGQPPQQPGFQPTQQLPTQAYPQQMYAPQAAAGAPKKGNGMLIGGGLVVVAALIGGAVLLMGGDDKKDPTITLAPVTTVAAPDTTIAAPDTTIAAPDTTVVDTTIEEGALVAVFDDTGTFSISVPNDLEVDTAPIGPTGTTPSITAAVVLEDFRNEEVTFGLIAVAGAVGSDLGSDAAEALAWLNPPDGVCTGRVDDTVETAAGLAMRASFTGCGGAGNKVLMAMQLPDRPVLIGIYMQGTADLVDLGAAAQFALESMFVF